MAYITIDQLLAAVPEEYRKAALDDAMTGDTSAMATSVCAAASLEVDGLICTKIVTPVANPPANLIQAAVAIAIELLFIRRSINAPRIATMADAWRDILRKIGDGKLPLSAALVDATAAPSGSIRTEPSRTTRSDGGMFV